MHKNTSSLGIVFAVINLTIALGCLFAQENKTSQITVVNKRDFETILNALFVAYPIDDGTREEWLTKIQKRDQAAAQLRFLGTNALPLLFDEVKIVGQIGKTNILLAVNRKAEISAAFQVIGPEAKPLVPNLGSVAHFVGDFSMIFGAVKVFDDDCGGFGIRPQRGASYGSKATPLLV